MNERPVNLIFKNDGETLLEETANEYACYVAPNQGERIKIKKKTYKITKTTHVISRKYHNIYHELVGDV